MQKNFNTRTGEDEIDLKELIKILWESKIFIFLFTTIITILSIVYALLKTPIYETRAIVKIGEYKSDNSTKIKVDNASALSAELRVLYIDLLKNEKDRLSEITSISVLKQQNDFISIVSHSISNELAKEEIEKVINYIKKKHQTVINEVIENKQLQYKNLEKKISFVKNTKLISIEEQINYQEKIVLNSLISKIKLNKQNIKEYENQLTLTEKNLSELKTSNSTLAAINLMEKRNLEEKINRLKLEYINLQNNKENLVIQTIPSLKRNKKNIIESELEILFEEKKILETSMLPHNYRNSEVLGKILVKDSPVEPKKRIIVIISFAASFIFAILLVLLRRTIKNMKG